MWIDKDSNGVQRSFGFVAPDGATEEKNEVLFPWSEKQLALADRSCMMMVGLHKRCILMMSQMDT